MVNPVFLVTLIHATYPRASGAATVNSPPDPACCLRLPRPRLGSGSGRVAPATRPKSKPDVGPGPSHRMQVRALSCRGRSALSRV